MASQPIQILLVEDNPNDAELALHALREHHSPHAVHVARDGAEAVDFLLARGAYADREGMPVPRLVLLDLKLPRVDGFDVLRTIRKNPRTQHVPVLVLSSSNQERDVAESYRLGANSYMVKPVDFDEFSQALRVVGAFWLILNHTVPAGSSGTRPDRG